MDLRESRTRGGVRHPWERARFAFLRALLARNGRLDAARALDVGSGDAWLATQWLEVLPAGARIACVDEAYAPDVLDALGLPAAIDARTTLPAGEFPLVFALDVAEHVEDDAAFIEALGARVARGGALLFTVPAWPALYSAHDRALLHHRRYTHASARALLRRTGLRIVEDGGFFHALLVPRLVALLGEHTSRLVHGEPSAERVSGSEHTPSSRWRLGEPAARLVARTLGLEQRLTHALGARGLGMPGLSYYALAIRD